MTAAGWDVVEAVASANAVLGMFEHPEDEIPPPHLWHHRERLDEWFAAVKQAREDRMRGVESVPQAGEDDENTVFNELTRGLRD